MKSPSLLLNSLAIGLALCAAPVAFSQSQFLDGTFTLTDWTKTDLTSGAGSSTMTQQTSGGNPGNYLQASNSIGAGLLAAVHIFNTAAYDPAQSGAIASVTFAFDTKNFAFSQAMQPVIKQNNIFWFGPVQSSTASWTTLTFTNLNANNFGAGPLQSTGLTLDFSSAGAPMTFGFSGANSDFYATSMVGVDNFGVTLNAIPEPSTYAAWVGLGALGLAFYRRRRRS